MGLKWRRWIAVKLFGNFNLFKWVFIFRRWTVAKRTTSKTEDSRCSEENFNWLHALLDDIWLNWIVCKETVEPVAALFIQNVNFKWHPLNRSATIIDGSTLINWNGHTIFTSQNSIFTEPLESTYVWYTFLVEIHQVMGQRFKHLKRFQSAKTAHMKQCKRSRKWFLKHTHANCWKSQKSCQSLLKLPKVAKQRRSSDIFCHFQPLQQPIKSLDRLGWCCSVNMNAENSMRCLSLCKIVFRGCYKVLHTHTVANANNSQCS